MNIFKNWTFALLLATTVGGFSTAIILPQTAAAACTETQILAIPPWYKGMLDSECNVKNPNDMGGFSPFIWHIVFNVVEMLLYLAGYVAVAFIIYGGFTYLISTGSPDKITSAKKTITNAIIGLLISIFSIGIVNIVAKVL